MCQYNTKIRKTSNNYLSLPKILQVTFNPSELQPGISIDCVLFSFHNRMLKVLLLKLKNMDKWALPGGFITKDKDIDSEARAVLEKRTGLNDIFLRQFYVFGDVSRNERSHSELLLEKGIIPREARSFFEQRFITIGYYALVEFEEVKQPKPDFASETCTWFSLEDLPELILDHEKIITKAHETLKLELNYQPIGLNLLPEQFSIPELQALYEIILGKKLDRRNFRRKIMGYDILKDTRKKRKGVKHKSPLLYEFDKKKYQKAMEAGLNSGW